MAQIMCPYCLTPQAFARSNKCQNPECRVQEVPQEYIDNARRMPPIWLTTFGTSQHGKTTYIDALAIWIENLGKITENISHEYLDSHTIEQIRTMRQRDRSARPEPESTSAVGQPLLISVDSLIPNQTHTIIVHDLPGELSDDMIRLSDLATAIKHSQTVFFIVSLWDLLRDRQRQLSDLFTIYQQAMRRLGASFEGKNILVVFTKADLLAKFSEADPIQLTDSILDYLTNDQYRLLRTSRSRDLTPLDFDDYVKKMGTISKELQEFTRDSIESGASFIAKIKKSNCRLEFCITSAQGDEVSAEGRLGVVNRFRVLDPFFWAINLNKQESGKREGILVIDGGGTVHTQDIPLQFHHALTRRGVGTETYYLGEFKSILSIGQSPTNLKQPRRFLSLIGPILDKLPEGTIGIALLEKEPRDLIDYLYTSWSQNLLIVALHSDVATYWPNHVLWEDDSDPFDIISDFVVVNNIVKP